MDYIINLGKKSKEKSVEDYIEKNVDTMIEKSVAEGKKRNVIEHKVSDKVTVSETKKLDILAVLEDFQEFPQYKGRGIAELAPDIQGSLTNEGKASLTLWYVMVSEEEYKNFVETIKAAGFEPKNRDGFAKETQKKHFEMSVSFSPEEGKLRLFYFIQNKDFNKETAKESLKETSKKKAD